MRLSRVLAAFSCPKRRLPNFEGTPLRSPTARTTQPCRLHASSDVPPHTETGDLPCGRAATGFDSVNEPPERRPLPRSYGENLWLGVAPNPAPDPGVDPGKAAINKVVRRQRQVQKTTEDDLSGSAEGVR